MIRFFRTLRQRLLAENRFRKYLLYAIGEIVLVVIGILIALQINTWNEGRKAENLEQDYYCRLLEDVALDHVQVNELMAASKERLQAANLALRFLLTDHPKKLDVAREINNAIKAIYSDFEANDAAFVDLKSGANLNIIRDKAVITALNNYFNKIEGYVSVIQVNGENALKIFYSHNDVFESGWALASLRESIPICASGWPWTKTRPCPTPCNPNF